MSSSEAPVEEVLRWNTLPADVIASIIGRLDNVADVCRALCVCRSWRDLITSATHDNSKLFEHMLFAPTKEGPTLKFISALLLCCCATVSIDLSICGTFGQWWCIDIICSEVSVIMINVNGHAGFDFWDFCQVAQHGALKVSCCSSSPTTTCTSQSLSFAYCGSLRRPDWERIQPCMPTLEYLDIRGKVCLGTYAAKVLSEATALTHLLLDDTKCINVDFLRIAFADSTAAEKPASVDRDATVARPMTHLSLAGCANLQAGAGLVLQQLTNLQHLVLDRTGITDHDVADIMQHCGASVRVHLDQYIMCDHQCACVM